MAGKSGRRASGAGLVAAAMNLWHEAGGTLEVRPWPYEMDLFRVAVDVHILDQPTFADEDELAAALRRATVTRRVWELFRK